MQESPRDEAKSVGQSGERERRGTRLMVMSESRELTSNSEAPRGPAVAVEGGNESLRVGIQLEDMLCEGAFRLDL
jgi:hypothetical protein